MAGQPAGDCVRRARRFYDHVSPCPATPPGDSNVNGLKHLNGFDFARYGVRVPAVIVSPRIAKGTVDHTKYDHIHPRHRAAHARHGAPDQSRPGRQRSAATVHQHAAAQRRRLPAHAQRPGATHPEASSTKPIDINRPLPQTGNWVGFLKNTAEDGTGPSATKATKQRPKPQTVSADHHHRRGEGLICSGWGEDWWRRRG